jgi:hypothetical protein
MVADEGSDLAAHGVHPSRQEREAEGGVPAPPRRAGGASFIRVLLIAGVGALLVGFAAFAANSAVQSDQPVARTMCMDTTCTYPMSVDGATAHPPQPKRSRSAPERLVRKILYICHIR